MGQGAVDDRYEEGCLGGKGVLKKTSFLQTSRRRSPALHTPRSLQGVVDCLGGGGEEQGERGQRHCVSGGQPRELSVDKDSYIPEDGFEQRFSYTYS